MEPSSKKEEAKKQKPLAIRTLREREEALSCLQSQREEDCKKSEAVAAEGWAEFLRNLQPGQAVEGQGVFLGQWQPKDREGNSLGKIFNVFAAPQDLTDDSGRKITLQFNDTVKRVAELRNWHGHNGDCFPNDTAVYEALKNGAYKGEWFIPTRDLLLGADIDNNRIQPDNLYAHRNTGAFKNTFDTASSRGKVDSPDWYWSCSEHRDNLDHAEVCRFLDGFEARPPKANGGFMSCRPVRAVPLPLK